MKEHRGRPSKKKQTVEKKCLKKFDNMPDAVFEPLPEEFRGENYHEFKPFTYKKIRLALLYIKAGYTQREICRILKISQATIPMWAANSPENQAVLEECYDSRLTVCEDMLFENAKKGDQRAIEFMLERRSPRFKKDAETKITITNQQIIDEVNQAFGIELGLNDGEA
jgi:hypothetical protein